MIQDFNKFFNFLKNEIKVNDNDERDLASKSPCSFCEPFTKDDIDNPDFNEEDWQEFWRMSKEYYPLHSVYGGSLGKDRETIISSERNELREHLRMMYKMSMLKGKCVLEIGYGFGGAGLEMIEMGADYMGIDYVTSNEDLPKDRFLEINVSGIPEGIMSGKKFDLVYSVNVFQHLTQKQRFDYIRQAHEILNDDGVFFFSVFERIPGQGVRDKYSTTFFNVHTKVDETGELQGFLSETGFTFDHSVRTICYETYCAYYVCRKKSV